ncbi:MAG: DNA-formamidopyrimidine glycosylase [Leptospiraceae bacterium]|nr:DNA-formamidopyrimidine glycosylase [Leptospiraceae bacterium]
MPELPDLEYLVPRLRGLLEGQTLERMEVFEPVVLRNLLGHDIDNVLPLGFQTVTRHGPFVVLDLGPSSEIQLSIIIHPMLAGRFSTAKRKKSTMLRLHLAQGHLDYDDDKKMGKVYLARPEQRPEIPGFAKQGLDILSSEFTEQRFMAVAQKLRSQVRVFLMDQSRLSAIGNAYADEILFEAGIHPKTRMNSLKEDDLRRLYRALRSVIEGAIEIIRQAQPAMEAKYRQHMKVRNRKDQPCTRCGSKIRRANVLGYDAFFCPVCQPDGGKGFIDWSSLEK